MKRSLSLPTLSLAAAMAVAGLSPALAATSTPAPSCASGGFGATHDRAGFRKMAKAMRADRDAARQKMLSALTPAHRTLLANVVGQLAVAQTPDPRAAAQQLDTALTPTEKSAILDAAKTLHEQMRTAFASMPNRPGAMQGSGGNMQGPGGSMQGPGGGMQGPDGGARHQPDAGTILLRMAAMPGGPHGPGAEMMRR